MSETMRRCSHSATTRLRIRPLASATDTEYRQIGQHSRTVDEMESSLTNGEDEIYRGDGHAGPVGHRVPNESAHIWRWKVKRRNANLKWSLTYAR